MGKHVRCKLAVGEPTGRRSSTWLVWFGRGDIYVSARTLSGTWKFTVHFPRPPLHPETLRYFGFTREHAKKKSGTPVSREQRTGSEPTDQMFGTDVSLEGLIRIPESELRPFPGNVKDVIWLQPAPEGMMTQLLILSAPASYDRRRILDAPNAPPCILETSLECGRTVWVLQQEVPVLLSELADVRAKLRSVWPALAKPGLGGEGTRATFFGKVNGTVAVMYEVAADTL